EWVGGGGGGEQGGDDPQKGRADDGALGEFHEAVHLAPPTFSSWIFVGEPSLRYGWISIVTPLSRSPSRSITRSTGWLRNASICAFFAWYSASSSPLSCSALPFAAERDASPAATLSIL